MFKTTESMVSNRQVDSSLHSHMNFHARGNNLLDLLHNMQEQNDDIQTFDEFKEAVNLLQFEEGEKIKPKSISSTLNPKMVKARYSLNENSFDRKPPTYESLNLPTVSVRASLEHSSGAFLNIVK